MYQKWATQLRKGYLELCVLGFLEQKQSAYGLEILNCFQSVGLEVNEGTLYPLLNRMQQNKWLDSEWQTPGTSGHPRRFYSLTEDSREQLPQMLEHFDKNHQMLTALRDLK